MKLLRPRSEESDKLNVACGVRVGLYSKMPATPGFEGRVGVVVVLVAGIAVACVWVGGGVAAGFFVNAAYCHAKRPHTTMASQMIAQVFRDSRFIDRVLWR